MLQISLCHATYQAGESGRRVRDAWFRNAHFPNRIEHCLAFEVSDHETRSVYGIPNDQELGFSADSRSRFITTTPGVGTSAVRNWNAAARISSGDLLIAIADDTVPEKGWDTKVEHLISMQEQDRILLSFTDGRCHEIEVGKSDSLLPRHPAITRPLYRDVQYLFPPRFTGLGADVALLVVALRHGYFLDARAVKLHHSVGNIFDEVGELSCFCMNQRVSPPNLSQQLIHGSYERQAVRSLLRMSPMVRLLITISCISRYADNTLKYYRFGRKNNLRVLAVRVTIRTLIQKVARVNGFSNA